MEHIKQILKDTTIVKLGAFWKEAKTTPQTVAKYIENPPGDDAMALMLQNVKAAVQTYLQLMEEIMHNGASAEDVMESNSKLFIGGNFLRAEKNDELDEIFDNLTDLALGYIAPKLLAYGLNGEDEEEEDAEDTEELSGIFEEDEEEEEMTAETPEVSEAVAELNGGQKVTAFLKTETTDDFANSQTGQERFGPKQLPAGARK